MGELIAGQMNHQQPNGSGMARSILNAMPARGASQVQEAAGSTPPPLMHRIPVAALRSATMLLEGTAEETAYMLSSRSAKQVATRMVLGPGGAQPRMEQHVVGTGRNTQLITAMTLERKRYLNIDRFSLNDARAVSCFSRLL